MAGIGCGTLTTCWMGRFGGRWRVRAGALTRGQLYGPRFQRLFPDVYVPVGTELDLATRSRAAYLHVADRGGVLAGFSAAELLGAGCAPRRMSAEVIVPRRGRRRTDLLVRLGTVTDAETCVVDGCGSRRRCAPHGTWPGGCRWWRR